MSETTKAWQEYQEGLDYQRSLGLDRKLPEFERFKQGDQWPMATRRTASLPRPVFNLVNFFIRSKRSHILNQSIKLLYSPADALGDVELAVQGAKDFTDYAATLWDELGQDELNEDFIEDCATNGAAFFHYYWDNDVTGGVSMRYNGSLRGEVIDALDIFFGNPQERRVQKQPYIIIAGRESVEALRELGREEGLSEEELERIRPDQDTAGYDAARRELRSSPKATVLTKYYRVDGEVYFSRCTRMVELIRGQPLTPGSPGRDGAPEEEAPGPQHPRRHAGGGAAKMTLYPIAAMSWDKRKKSIYGTGEAESLLPNQKAVNFNIAMMLLSVQQTAWPKIISKAGALQQPITNVPGEQLTDYYQSGDGIKYLQPPSFPAMAVNLADKVIEYSRTMQGINEVTTGEAFTSNMAASAIIALQNQSRQPTENLQKRFYRVIREVGQIWEQFFKTYYSMDRPLVTTGEDGSQETRVFNGSRYAGLQFRQKVDVVVGSSYSESLAVATLDKLFDKGEITFEEYIELAPQPVVPFREQLKKMLRERVQKEGGEEI